MKGRKLFAFSRPSGEAAPALISRGLQRRPSTKLCTEEKQPADGSNAGATTEQQVWANESSSPPKKTFLPLRLGAHAVQEGS